VGIVGAVGFASFDNGTPLPGLPTSFNVAKTSHCFGFHGSNAVRLNLWRIAFLRSHNSIFCRHLHWLLVRRGVSRTTAATQLLSFYESCP
jgi:hypothetical protein